MGSQLGGALCVMCLRGPLRAADYTNSMNHLRRINPDRAALGLVALAAVGVIGEAAARTSLGDAQTARECRYPPLSSFITEEHVRELEANHFVVIRNVLSAATLRRARDNVEALGNQMETANHSNDDDVRQDQILSIREGDTDDACEESGEHGDTLIHCIKMLRGVPFLLSRFGYTASHSYVVPRQCQLARYKPDGSVYVRHLDRCNVSMGEMGLVGWLRASDYRHRVVTAILYLNHADWDSGGELRVFHNDESTDSTEDCKGVDAEKHSDIVPTGGKLILFDSSRVEHQVLASHLEDRYALTCWVNGVLA